MTAAKKPVFDIAKPGAPVATPSATSRPIIIKHPTVTDPMVNDEPKANPEPVEVPSSKKIVIQPLSREPLEAPTAEPVPTEATPESEPAPEPEPAPAPAEEKPTNDEKPVIDDEAKAAERASRVQQLAASQEYYLPIQTVEQRRSKRAAIIGSLTIILLLAAWYNVSLDAGLVPNSLNLPHTSFFTEK